MQPPAIAGDVGFNDADDGGGGGGGGGGDGGGDGGGGGGGGCGGNAKIIMSQALLTPVQWKAGPRQPMPTELLLWR